MARVDVWGWRLMSDSKKMGFVIASFAMMMMMNYGDMYCFSLYRVEAAKVVTLLYALSRKQLPSGPCEYAQ